MDAKYEEEYAFQDNAVHIFYLETEKLLLVYSILLS